MVWPWVLLMEIAIILVVNILTTYEDAYGQAITLHKFKIYYITVGKEQITIILILFYQGSLLIHSSTSFKNPLRAPFY